jgi:hypothetical protein
MISLANSWALPVSCFWQMSMDSSKTGGMLKCITGILLRYVYDLSVLVSQTKDLMPMAASDNCGALVLFRLFVTYTKIKCFNS